MHAKPTRLNLEQLESREVPATLVSGQTVSYQDVDGDLVTVTFSRSVLTPANVNSIFQFDSGSVDGSNLSAQRLTNLQVTALGESASRINISVDAERIGTGDGRVQVAQISADGIDLGTVSVDGDLSLIRAGDSNRLTTGLNGLNVWSIGATPSKTIYHSIIQGRLNSIVVSTNVQNAHIEVQGGTAGQIGTLSVGGQIQGTGNAFSGRISASGLIRDVTVLGDIVGGEGDDSGTIVGGSFQNVVLNNVNGGLGARSGSLQSVGRINQVSLRTLNGGSGDGSGSIQSGNRIGVVTVNGDVVGGAGIRSGTIQAVTSINQVTTSRLIGSEGFQSGSVIAGTQLGEVSVLRGVRGGSGEESGRIQAGQSIGTVTVGSISRSVDAGIVGGLGARSGTVSAGTHLTRIELNGGLVGAGGTESGSILVGGNIETVRLVGRWSESVGGNRGRLEGGIGERSGSIVAGGRIENAEARFGLLGGAGAFSGSIISTEGIWSISLGSSINGGAGADSGSIISRSTLGTFEVFGSLIGGIGDRSGSVSIASLAVNVRFFGDIRGGRGTGSGSLSFGSLDQLTIDGSVIGGQGNFTGRIQGASFITIEGDVIGGSASLNNNLVESGFITGHDIIQLIIRGSLVAGNNGTTGIFLRNGAVAADGVLRNAIIGNIIGNSNHRARITAGAIRSVATPRWIPLDQAIGSLQVLGRVEHAVILAGYTPLGPSNADATIGSIRIGGDFIASSIAAGIAPVDSYFGNRDDVVMTGVTVKNDASLLSTIRSVRIDGRVIGTSTPGETFGIVAQYVWNLQLGGRNIVLRGGPNTDYQLIGGTTNVYLSELT